MVGAFAVSVLAACMPSIDVPEGAAIACTADDECPSDLVCLESEGLCARPGSACVTDDGEARPDGASCGEDGALCVGGRCIEARCGDGFRARDEECDPGVDAVCRDDCTFPFCGDGVIDAGESCERGDVGCDLCTLICFPTETANCNGDPADGCECEEDVLLQFTDGEFVVLGARSDDDLWIAVFHENAGDTWELWRVPLVGGAPEVVVEDQLLTTVGTNGDVVVVAFSDEQSSTIARIDDGTMVPIYNTTSFTVQEVAVDATRVFVAVDGIQMGDLETGELLGQLTPECGDALRLQTCGGTLLCLEDETEDTWAIDIESGDAEVIATGPFRFGCSETGEILWHDFARVGVGLGADARIIANMPLPNSAITLPFESVLAAGDDAIVTFALASVQGTFLASRERHATYMLQEGFALVSSRDGIVSYDVGSDALLRVPRPR